MAAFSEDKYDPISLNAIWLKNCANVDDKESMCIRIWDMCHITLRMIYVVIKEAARILMYFPVKLWFRRCRYFSLELNNKLVFVVPAYNDSRSLQRVIEIVSASKDDVLVLNKREYYKAFPRLLIFFKSIQSIIRLLKNISKLPAGKKDVIISNLHTLFLSPGFTYYARKIINNSIPQLVVFANDHSYDRRALIYSCEENGITTLYVQHASVSYAFPELRTTYSFLDGLDALNKYIAGGKEIHGKVFLLGAIRYDELRRYRKLRKQYMRHCIGIAVNSLDDMSMVAKLCAMFLEYYSDVNIKLRFHPAMKKNKFKYEGLERILYTYATEEQLMDYLDSIDLQIAGDTGIHLDSILGGVPSLAYNFNSSLKCYGDSYNYVKTGLIQYADSFEQVRCFIENNLANQIDPCVVRKFDAAYDGNYAGNCSEIVADFIMYGCKFDLFIEKKKLKEIMYKHISYYTLHC